MDAIEENSAADAKEIQVQTDISSSMFKIRKAFFIQLFWVGTIFFASTPVSTIISQRYIQESN